MAFRQSFNTPVFSPYSTSKAGKETPIFRKVSNVFPYVFLKMSQY